MPPVRRKSPRATPRRGRSSSVASVVSVSSAGGATSPPPSASKPKRARKSKAASAARPSLPTERNPRLEGYPEQPVRLQLIEREEREIIVGRVKLPSLNGQDHAFLLKRFDTDAVAASSMFRVAFPYANEAAEATEMKYLESRYETDVANGGRIAVATTGVNETPVKRSRGRPRKSETPRKDAASTDNESVAGSSAGEMALPAGSTGVRLQGTWIPANDAAEVAQEYGIFKFAEPLIKAVAKIAEDGSGPMLVESPVQKTPEKKRGRPSKRARKATEEPEEDQLADEQSSSRSRIGIVQTNHYDDNGRLTGLTLGPYIPGMSEDEESGNSEDYEWDYERDSDGEIAYSGCAPVMVRVRKRAPAAAAEPAVETIAEEEEEEETGVDDVVEAVVEKVARSRPVALSQAEIDAQIAEAKALAAGVQKAGAAAAVATTSSTKGRGQKRAAVYDTPTADLDPLQDDEEENADAGRVTRAFRRGTRVARRRPVATTAGVLTAAGALGAAGAAYMTGVDVNTAFQTIQQTVAGLGLQNWFF